jgi:hypothetical protein
VSRGERFACLICEATFASIEAMDRHEAKRHPALGPRWCKGGCLRDLHAEPDPGESNGVCLACVEDHNEREESAP